MRATQVASGEASPILQLKRSLLPIDEYAAREGVSREIVEKCGQLGIVQIRRYKGRTFVVDIPLGPYSCVSEGIKEAVRPIDMAAQARKISELVQKIIPSVSLSEDVREMPDLDVHDDIKERAESEETIEAGTIAELVKRMSRRASKTFEASVGKNDGNGDIGRVDQIPGSVQVIHTERPKSSGQSAQLTDTRNQAENFVEPTRILQRDSHKIIGEPKTSGDENTRAEILTEPIQPPDWEIFESPDELPELTEEDMEAKEVPEPVQIQQENKVHIGTLSQQVESNRIWKVATILSMVFFVTALIVNVGFYVDRQVQLGRLEMVYAGIQKAYHEASQANEEVEAIKNKLTESRAEVRRFRRELYSSRAEVKAVEKELTRVRENLRTIHQANAEALERFNSQIKNLITLTEQAERE